MRCIVGILIDYNGYGTIEIPINPREIQTSIRGNMLVDQSVKNYVDVSAS